MEKKPEETTSETAEASFTRYAEPLIHEVLAQADSMETEPDAEALHRLRISLRQLRTLFWAYRPLLDSKFERQQREVYSCLANAAGSTRDWDILIGLVEEHVDEQLIGILVQTRTEAARQSSETLSHPKLKMLLRDMLNESNRQLNTVSQRTMLKKFVRKRLSSAQHALRKGMKRASQARELDYVSFHDVRKAAKKVRYLVEFFGPLLSDKQRGELKRLSRVQKRFGALNDVVTSEELLKRHVASSLREVRAKPALRALKKEKKKRFRSAAKLL